MKPGSPEAVAKVALLTHLRGAGQLRSNVIIAELAVEKWARRADVVTAGSELTCYEVKSRADRLTRLEDQLTAYSAVFDRVYAVVATKHMNAVVSQVPDYIGLKEVVQTEKGLEARQVRDALPSPAVTIQASLNLLPVVELAKLIRSEGGGPSGGLNRASLVEMARAIPLAAIRVHLREYLRLKHAASSSAFIEAIAGRRIKASDLVHLSIWQRPDLAGHDEAATFADWLSSLSSARAFGAVPDDIRSLLTAD